MTEYEEGVATAFDADWVEPTPKSKPKRKRKKVQKPACEHEWRQHNSAMRRCSKCGIFAPATG